MTTGDSITIGNLVETLPGLPPLRFISSGMPPLDAVLGGGFVVGDLTVVGATMLSCSSSLTASVALNAAQSGVKVLLVCPNDMPHRTAARLVAQRSDRPLAQIHGGGMDAD